MKFLEILLVMLGGSAGAITRYLIGVSMMQRFPHPPIPVAILAINTIGSFGLGIVFSMSVSSQFLILFLATGFFGAFTTFSTFSIEAVQLWEKGRQREFITYLTLTILLSLIGFITAQQVIGWIFIAALPVDLIF